MPTDKPKPVSLTSLVGQTITIEKILFDSPAKGKFARSLLLGVGKDESGNYKPAVKTSSKGVIEVILNALARSLDGWLVVAGFVFSNTKKKRPCEFAFCGRIEKYLLNGYGLPNKAC